MNPQNRHVRTDNRLAHEGSQGPPRRRPRGARPLERRPARRFPLYAPIRHLHAGFVLWLGRVGGIMTCLLYHVVTSRRKEDKRGPGDVPNQEQTPALNGSRKWRSSPPQIVSTGATVGRRVRRTLSAARRQRHLHSAVRREAPQQLLGLLRPRRRGARRGPHLHLLQGGDRRRSHEQLAGSRRDARDAQHALQGMR